MIIDELDLEQIADRYDSGKMILVGPPLTLSISKYRYFFVAGEGRKVCESIGIGFAGCESDTRKQYDEIVKKLENRFPEILTFTDNLEMARAVHSRWPNEETTKFLANAEATAPTETPVLDGDGQDTGLQPNHVSEVPWKPIGGGMPRQPDDSDTVATIAIAKSDASAKDTLVGMLDKLPSARTERDLLLVQSLLRPNSTIEAGTRSGEISLMAGQDRLSPDDNDPRRGDHLAVTHSDTLSSQPRRQGFVHSSLRRLSVIGAAAIVAFMVMQETAHDPLLISDRLMRIGSEVLHDLLALKGSSAISGKSQVAQYPLPVAASASLPAATAERKQDATRDVASVAVSRAKAKTDAQPDFVSASVPARQSEESPAPAEATAAASARPDEKSATRDDTRQVTGSVGTAPSSAKPMPSSHSASAGSGDLSISRLSEGDIAMLVGRGNSFIQNGDFASARLLLRRAAEGGSADAALTLGETFDPKFLNSVGALGVNSDLATARQWYEKAATLGSAAAAQRLAHLDD